MRRVVAFLTLGLLLAGCGASQTRGDYPDKVDNEVVNRESALHGAAAGFEIATIFESDQIRKKRMNYQGKARGLSVAEFWRVEIAKDPHKPSTLSQVGFFHLLREEEGTNFVYEFFNGDWDRIAYLMPSGDLYSFQSSKQNNLGKFQLESAIQKLFPAPNGYGYDPYLQDRLSVKHHDVEVASLDSDSRGVKHIDHKSRPAVWVYTPLKGGEAIDVAEQFRKNRAYEGYDMIKKRLLEKKTGDYGNDEYGGLDYKDGHPVDENGRKLKPGDMKSE
ncbi:hypothetical protein OAU50_01375 [Planctomycetota bacterium]|nr:hypothetical protein [Planctomycetota bacterium]